MRGPLAAASAWARADVRARWRSLLALGLIAGVTGGLVLGCIDGATRTGSALDRLRHETRASDAIVFASQAGEVAAPSWDRLEAEPEVADLAPWALVFGELDGDPGGLVFTPADQRWIQSVDRPVVTSGRLFDPSADDEVVVASAFAAAQGISVGDTYPFTPYTADDEEGQAGPPHGPGLVLRVVGLVQTPLEELFVSDGLVLASPGLLDQHPEVTSYQNAVVRLGPGPHALPDLQRHVDADVAAGTPVLDLQAVARRVTTTTGVERTALLVLALVIALAGAVLVGQATSRSASAVGVDARSLGGMGMDRREISTAGALSHLPAALVAATTCTAVALLTSTRLPFGLAGRLDPEPGLHVDPATLVPGTMLLVAAVLGAAWVAAFRATTPGALRTAKEQRGVGGWIRQHASPTVGMGTTLALRPVRGARGVPVRPALLGVVVGVLGIAGAATVDAGLHDAVSHPERVGVAWDVQVGDEAGDAPADDLVATVRAQPEVADAVEVDRASVTLDGVGVPTYALRPRGGETAITLTTLDGRSPTGPGEAAVGPATARALDLHIGDRVPVGPNRTPTTVVGTALFPTDVHAEFDEGLWLAPEDLDGAAAAAGSDAGEGAPFESLLAVRLAPEVGIEQGVAALEGPAEEAGATAMPVDVPPELTNLGDLVPLPRWLGAFLALLAVAALLHVLASTARVRAHDFAVLRAIGVTRRGTRMVLHVQSTATFVVGLLLGIPLGLVVGRVAWRLIAGSVPLRIVSPVAVVALVLLVPGALLLAQLAALEPGRRVRRLHPAEVLRTE